MTPPRPTAHPSASSGIPRRSVLTAGAWSLPVIALAASTPGAAASGTSPSFSTIDAFPDPVAADTLVFTLLMSDLPALPAQSEGDPVGLSIILCLPVDLPDGVGVEVVGAASGDVVDWAFTDGSAGFQGGEVFVYNTDAIPAGYSGTLLISIRSTPASGINGTLGADVVLGETGGIDEASWAYAYPGSPTAPFANCAAA